MKENPSYYAILSAEVRYDNNLKANSKLLYAEITALCNMNAKCFASNRYFANLYGKSKGAISGWIGELVKNGYIKVNYTYKEGSKEIDYRYISILKGGVSVKDNTLLKKTVKNSNTNNNTTNNNNIFKKPLLIDVKNYCIKRKNNIEAESFINFYDSKGWMVGKNKMKDWRACIRTWEMREKKKPTKTSKIDSQINEYLKGKEYL
mgnify:CR=1 FL=1|tara:strand:+ start:325 stop:939 length:615 start_codon:yes stop_codon:yes gene_type:complete